jgi:hypothetical protein
MPAELKELEQKNAQLQDQIDELTRRLHAVESGSNQVTTLPVSRPEEKGQLIYKSRMPDVVIPQVNVREKQQESICFSLSFFFVSCTSRDID